jgi:hypothetical protein
LRGKEEKEEEKDRTAGEKTKDGEEQRRERMRIERELPRGIVLQGISGGFHTEIQEIDDEVRVLSRLGDTTNRLTTDHSRSRARVRHQRRSNDSDVTSIS